MIKGVEAAGAELMVNHLLAMDPGGGAGELDGIPTTEPAFKLPALWIPLDKEDEAKFSGYTVVDNSTVVATHLTEVIRKKRIRSFGASGSAASFGQSGENKPQSRGRAGTRSFDPGNGTKGAPEPFARSGSPSGIS